MLYDQNRFYLDVKPADWKFPFTPEIVRSDAKSLEALEELYDESVSRATVYGTGKRGVFKIKIEAEREQRPAAFRWKIANPMEF